jgi:hypothetical protein
MAAAFFQRGILQLLVARERGFAIKVGYWSWLPLKAITAACRRWQQAPRDHRPREQVWLSPSGRTSGSAWCCTEARPARDVPELAAGPVHAG